MVGERAAPSRSKELASIDSAIKYLSKYSDLSERLSNSAFTREHLMLKLDAHRLAALEDEWMKSEEGLSLKEFVWLMQLAIPHKPEDKLLLYLGFIRLFNDIDINGDGTLEWFEFTQYMTDAVITQKKLNLIEDEEARRLTLSRQKI